MDIWIMPSFLIVRDLPPVPKPRELKFIPLSENRTRVHGTPAALYSFLYELAKDYDISLI